MTPLSDIQRKATSIVGPVQWDGAGVTGLCACPGQQMHTGHNAASDTTVFLEGAPTIYCFHTACRVAVAEANLRLRRMLASSSWEMVLPDGSLLRSGDHRIPEGHAAPPPLDSAERRMLRDIESHTTYLRPAILRHFAWAADDIMHESPIQLSGEPCDDWQGWLDMWEPADVVWVGDTYDSGQERHRDNFRTRDEWRKVGLPVGQFTCGSTFAPGTFARKNANARPKFLVIESDTLTKSEMGGVFLFLRNRLRYNLHAVVDTGGKSLHGWFNLPPNEIFAARLKVALVALGCDPALFKPSQPVRVPGAMRTTATPQSLLWLQLFPRKKISTA